MANDLTMHLANPGQMISSPALRRLRRISVGTVQWPGQPSRTYLPAGSTLSTALRAEAEQALAQLRAADQSTDVPDVRRQRLGLVSKMLLAYPIAGASAASGQARGEAYLDALDDVPPWAIAEAVKAWHKGQCGDDHDYRWAPAPAVLRAVALKQAAPMRAIADHIAGLLSAVPLEQAMEEQAYSRSQYVVEGFKKLSTELHTSRRPETVIAEDRMRRAERLGREIDRVAEQQAAAE